MSLMTNQTYQFSPDHVCDTGSGQQSVTGVSSVEDSNSYWSVRGPSGALCHRGTPVKCGQTIRLTHVNTGRNLHSHYFASPLSSNQVSGVRGERLNTKSPPTPKRNRCLKASRDNSGLFNKKKEQIIRRQLSINH